MWNHQKLQRLETDSLTKNSCQSCRRLVYKSHLVLSTYAQMVNFRVPGNVANYYTVKIYHQ